MLELLNLRRNILLHLRAIDAFLASGLPGQGYHGNTLHNANFTIRPFDGANLLRIVRQKSNASITTKPQIQKDRSRQTIRPRVARMSEENVCFHRIMPQILQVVGFQLAEEADPSPFLPQIYDDTTRRWHS